MLIDIKKIKGDKWDKESKVAEFIKELFEKHADLFLEDEKFTFTRHPDRFVNAVLMLDSVKKVKKSTVIAGSDHDIIYFDVNHLEFAAKMTEEDVIELVRGGISFDESEGFTMFT
jgi:hypothetical protein